MPDFREYTKDEATRLLNGHAPLPLPPDHADPVTDKPLPPNPDRPSSDDEQAQLSARVLACRHAWQRIQLLVELAGGFSAAADASGARADSLRYSAKPEHGQRALQTKMIAAIERGLAEYVRPMPVMFYCRGCGQYHKGEGREYKGRPLCPECAAASGYTPDNGHADRVATAVGWTRPESKPLPVPKRGPESLSERLLALAAEYEAKEADLTDTHKNLHDARVALLGVKRLVDEVLERIGDY